jgi:carbonic anhydrase
MEQSITQLLVNNKEWSEAKRKSDPDYFTRLSLIQKPYSLWIGCSDSRVHPDTITGTEPGEMFIHRNIANMVVNTDVNLLSVLDYAVTHLKVKHVIVCGHYGCGGIKEAMNNNDLKLVLNMWLRNVKDVYRMHRKEIDTIPDAEMRNNRLVELNVQEQVLNLAKTSIIQRAWKNEQRPDLHGWVYGLKDGLIKSVFHMDPNTHIDSIYEFDNL